jgi:hypothetical protein
MCGTRPRTAAFSVNMCHLKRMRFEKKQQELAERIVEARKQLLSVTVRKKREKDGDFLSGRPPFYALTLPPTTITRFPMTLNCTYLWFALT